MGFHSEIEELRAAATALKEENRKLHNIIEMGSQDIIRLGDLRLERDRLRVELELLKNPSYDRCMELSALRQMVQTLKETNDEWLRLFGIAVTERNAFEAELKALKNSLYERSKSSNPPPDQL